MSDPNKPTADSDPTIDRNHPRGEEGYDRLSRTAASAAPRDPVAYDLPGAVPGNTGIDDTGARMIPAGNAAGEPTPGGTSAEGAGGAGLPGGTAPRDDDRKPKRV
jgi:hypothetical protein